jgi:hypothetical protein
MTTETKTEVPFPPPFVEDANLPAPLDGKPPAKLVNPPEAAALPVGGVSLAAALAAARDRCEPAPKDKYHSYHRYWYSSGDSVLKTGHAALASSGLSFLPLKFEDHVTTVGNVGHHEIKSVWLLIHSSGESMAIPLPSWPVLPERGKAINVAKKIALKEMLTALTQIVLLMPGGDTVPQENGEEGEVTMPATAPTPIRDDQKATIQNLVKLCLIKPETFDKGLARYGVTALDQLNAEQADIIIANLSQRYGTPPEPAPEAAPVPTKSVVVDALPGTPDWTRPGNVSDRQLDEIDGLCVSNKISTEQFFGTLKMRYGLEHPSGLSQEQAQQIIDKLKARLAGQK